jgi:hypothetical protein
LIDSLFILHHNGRNYSQITHGHARSAHQGEAWMSTPFDRRIIWLHWMGSEVGENDIPQLAATVKTYSPNAAGIAVKISDGALWQGVFDSKPPLAIRSASALQGWVTELAARGLETHTWAVIRGQLPSAEADLIRQASRVPGVKSIILDLHARDWYESGMPASRASALAGKIRAQVGQDFHLGVAFDPRGVQPSRVYLDTWAAVANSLHPRIFHWTYSEGLRGPQEYLEEAFTALAAYNLPIIPMLQACEDPATRARVPENDITAAGNAAFGRGAAGITYFRLGAAGPAEFRGVSRVTIPGDTEPVVITQPTGDPVEYVVTAPSLAALSEPGSEPRLILESQRLTQNERFTAYPATRTDEEGVTYLLTGGDFWVAEKRSDGSEVYALPASQIPTPTRKFFLVVTDSLRVRTGPSASHPEAPGGSLARGTQVEVVPDSRTEAGDYAWWQHSRGWSAERKISSNSVYMMPYDLDSGIDLPEPPWRFERFLLDLNVAQWFYYYGNTIYAFNNGHDHGYDSYSQGLHGGIDFGHPGGATVYAGVTGTFAGPGQSFGPFRLDITIGDYRLIYGHLAAPASYPVGATITPDMVMGRIDVNAQHVHLEIRYQNRYIVNPLIFFSQTMREQLFLRFPPTGTRGFYASPRWDKWLTPLDQPTLVLAGPVIGPRAVT